MVETVALVEVLVPTELGADEDRRAVPELRVLVDRGPELADLRVVAADHVDVTVVRVVGDVVVLQGDAQELGLERAEDVVADTHRLGVSGTRSRHPRVGAAELVQDEFFHPAGVGRVGHRAFYFSELSRVDCPGQAVHDPPRRRGVRFGTTERLEDILELLVEDAVAVENVGCEVCAVVRVVRMREQPALGTVGRGEPDVGIGKAALLAEVFEDRRVQTALVVADAHRFTAAGEDREGRAVVAEVRGPDVGEGHAGVGDRHQVGNVLGGLEDLFAPHSTGERDDHDPLGLALDAVWVRRRDRGGVGGEGSGEPESPSCRGTRVEELAAVEGSLRVVSHVSDQ